MKVLYFAWLKQKVGLAEEEVQPPAEVTDVAKLLDWLAARDRAPLIPIDTLRRDPHLEMHTRGG